MEISEQTRLQRILKKNGTLPRKKMTLLKDATEYLEGFEASKAWLNSIKSNLTKNKYAKALFRYCAGVGLNPSELVRLKPNQPEIILRILELKESGIPASEITINENEAEQKLENYLNSVAFKDTLTIKHAVISFYNYSNRSLSPRVAEKISQKELQPEDYRLLKIGEIAKMADATTNPRDEFLIWFLQSTGMRRRTIPQLMMGDLKLVVQMDGETKILPLNTKHEGQLDAIAPIFLQIGSERLKGKYRNLQQLSFLHFKCFQKLQSYWRWMQQKKIAVTSQTPLIVSFKNHEQPLKHGSIRNIVVNASVSAFGEDKQPFTPHDLRRFHFTTCENARIPQNWILKLQGKRVKSEQSPYSLPNILDLHKAFRDAVSYFVPQNEPQPQQHLAKRITQQDEIIKRQEETLRKIERITMYSLEKHRFVTREAEEACLKATKDTKKPLKQIIKKYAIPEDQ